MAFIAACGYCHGKVRVSDRAEGSSLTCPRCGNAFTVVPMDHPPENPGTVTAPTKQPSLPAAPDQTREEDVQEAPTPETSGWRVDPVGLAAFACGSAGLLLASIPMLHPATIPLAGLGLLIGVV